MATITFSDKVTVIATEWLNDVDNLVFDILAYETLTFADSSFLVGDGSNFVVESGATARTSLGLTIGTNVQAWDAQLDDIAALAVTDSNFIVGDGSNWVAETGSTARASMGADSATNLTSGSLPLARLPTVLTAKDADLWDGGDKTISTSSPSGGSDGDVWFKYTA